MAESPSAAEMLEQEETSGEVVSSEVDLEAYRNAVGEELHETLDISRWHSGDDAEAWIARIDAEIEDAVHQETHYASDLRRLIFPEIPKLKFAAPSAGVYVASKEGIGRIHRGILLNGGVEACDGTRTAHDTLPLTIVRIGVCLVSYNGHQDTWGQTLFRRDVPVRHGNPLEAVIELLDRRGERGGQNQPDRRGVLTSMLQRGIMAHAERAILTRASKATWRMGHGNPAPHELVTGSGTADLMIESTRVIRELVEGHKKFVFVASEADDALLLTIGNALRPLEYVVFDTLYPQLYRAVRGGSYRMLVKHVDSRWDGTGAALTTQEWIERFRDTVAPQIVRGVYRASSLAPAQIFYAHRDHVHEAVHIAIADSVLQEHRGFPLLIDLADRVCTGVFGTGMLSGTVAAAYTRAGAPWQFLSERMTRRG